MGNNHRLIRSKFNVGTLRDLRGKQNESDDMTNVHRLVLILAVAASLPPSQAVAQGETTSAIVGQVRDTTNAVVPGATVAIANLETGLRRTAKTDDAGRFNFPQLKPGIYSVKAEAQGFEPQQNDSVSSSLGQKQAVDFILKIAQAQVRTENSTQNAPALGVAAYGLLLLAATQVYGKSGAPDRQHQPKWYHRPTQMRATTNELINQLRIELWASALRPGHFSDFITATATHQKSKKSDFNPAAAMFSCVC